jgi:hypothetical protein
MLIVFIHLFIFFSCWNISKRWRIC